MRSWKERHLERHKIKATCIPLIVTRAAMANVIERRIGVLPAVSQMRQLCMTVGYLQADDLTLQKRKRI